MGKALLKLRLGKSNGVRGREFQVEGTACAEAKRQERLVYSGNHRANICLGPRVGRGGQDPALHRALVPGWQLGAGSEGPI